MLGSEQLGHGAILPRVAARGRLTVAFFRAEIAVGSSMLATLGLIASAMALQTLVLSSPGHFRPADSTIFAIFEPLALIASLGACLIATVSLRKVLNLRTRRMLCVVCFACLAVLSGIGISHTITGVGLVVQGQPYT